MVPAAGGFLSVGQITAVDDVKVASRLKGLLIQSTPTMRLFFIPALLALARPAIAWGAAGHEIVATIAQVHLHPDVEETIKGILPREAGGRLASVAAWADGVRGRYRETGPMHYVNRESGEGSEDKSPSRARIKSERSEHFFGEEGTTPSEARKG